MSGSVTGSSQRRSGLLSGGSMLRTREKLGISVLLLLSLSCVKKLKVNTPYYDSAVAKEVYYQNWKGCEEELVQCVNLCSPLVK